MRHARRGRREAAPFGFLLFLACVLGACGTFAASQPVPDQMAAVIAGARVQLSPEITLPAGSGVKVALALERVTDRPIARDLRITVTDSTGVALDDAAVVVIAQMPGMNDALIQATGRPDGTGRYVARVVFPMGGAYAVQVIVKAHDAAGSLRFEIDIAG
jgi:hypothetical protein